VKLADRDRILIGVTGRVTVTDRAFTRVCRPATCRLIEQLGQRHAGTNFHPNFMIFRIVD
jgi:hypothetical protein